MGKVYRQESGENLMNETIEERQNEDKKKFLEALKQVAIITVACARTGISKASIYRWKQEDEEFAQAVEKAQKEGHSIISDLAESKLITEIRNGNLTAIIFYLKTHNKDYKQKFELTGKDDTPIPVDFINNVKTIEVILQTVSVISERMKIQPIQE